MIANFLLSPIYIAYNLGDNGNNELQYSNPQKVFAQIGDVSSFLVRENVGSMPDYDRVIIVPCGEKTQYINEQTRVWVERTPNESQNNMDYEIKRLGDIVDNNLPIFLSSLTPNYKPLYYAIDGSILRAKVELDNLVAQVPFNQYLPINKATKVWLTRPTSLEDKTNLITLTKKEKLKKSYRLFFERVL